MSIDDINELKAHLELRTPKPQREIDWLAHEAEYRKTRGAIGASEKEYAATVGPARGKVDLADQALVERAVSRGETVMAVRSQEEAERIFHTMDEMARRPESGFKMAASKGEGDLPFRGPEHHPFPERGATRATHFNVEYVHEGRQVNLHIYWTPVP